MDTEPLIVEQSRWRLGLLSLFFLCLSSGSGFMLHKMSSSGLDVDLFGNLFFGAASPLFGATAVLAMIQALSSKPQMVLSDEGIFDCNLKMGVLPWSEMAGAQVRQMLNQRNVELQPRDPEQCRRRQPWRLLSGYSLAVGASPFILTSAIVTSQQTA